MLWINEGLVGEVLGLLEAALGGYGALAKALLDPKGRVFKVGRRGGVGG